MHRIVVEHVSVALGQIVADVLVVDPKHDSQIARATVTYTELSTPATVELSGDLPGLPKDLPRRIEDATTDHVRMLAHGILLSCEPRKATSVGAAHAHHLQRKLLRMRGRR